MSNSSSKLWSYSKKYAIYLFVAGILRKVHARNIVHNRINAESICISHDQRVAALQDWRHAFRTSHVDDKQRDLVNLSLVIFGPSASLPSPSQEDGLTGVRGGIVPHPDQSHDLASFYYELFTSPPRSDDQDALDEIQHRIESNIQRQFHLTRSLQYVPGFRHWEEGATYVRLLLRFAIEFVYYADNLAETHQDLNILLVKSSMQYGMLDKDDTELENGISNQENAVALAQRLLPILQTKVRQVYTHMIDLICAACSIVLPACSGAPQYHWNKHFRPVDMFVYILAETLEHCDSTPEERDLCQVLGITPGRFTSDGGKRISVSETIRALYETPDACSYAGLHGEKAFAHILDGGTMLDDYIPTHRLAYKPPLRIIRDIGTQLCNYQTFHGTPRESLAYEYHQTNPYVSYWYSIAKASSCDTTQKPVPLPHLRNEMHRMTDLLFHVTNVLVKAVAKFPMRDALSAKKYRQAYMMVQNGSIRIPYGTNVIQVYKDQSDDSVSMWVPDTVQGKEKLMDPLTWDFPSQPVRLHLYHDDGSVSISPDVFEYSVIREHIAEKGYHPIRFEPASVAYFDHSAYCQIVSWLDQYADEGIKYAVDTIRNAAPEIACLWVPDTDEWNTTERLPSQSRRRPYLSRTASVRKGLGIV
jgi:hypothetical protein